MPRKPRIEYAGAVYHVMNRGNYRADLFSLETTGASFEEGNLGTPYLFLCCHLVGEGIGLEPGTAGESCGS